MRISPRRFQDSNGDGVGDLNVIHQSLGYLRRLGIVTIWLAPSYPSPKLDFGYDISNYAAVDRLLAAAWLRAALNSLTRSAVCWLSMESYCHSITWMTRTRESA